MVLHSGSKIDFFLIFKTKMPFTSFVFTDFDINAHEGPALVGESESVQVLKNLFCTVGQKLIFLDF